MRRTGMGSEISVKAEADDERRMRGVGDRGCTLDAIDDDLLGHVSRSLPMHVLVTSFSTAVRSRERI